MWDGGKFTKFQQGEYIFSIRQFAPFKAIKVLGELQKIIGPALAGALTGLKNAPNADTNNFLSLAPVVSDALEKLAYNLDGDKLQNAMELLLDKNYVAVEVVAKNGTKNFTQLDEGLINEIFTGRTFDLLALMVEVFRVNFMDFSKLSSIPSGVREVFGEIKSPFQGN
ncbi:phage tail assembly chaperone [Megamonas hypermegale]|uniref:phage tail assembly chaperone n=1 Tax=Megamonas hypermegale TaxID=158847 RepID=UPI0026E987F2|nr:hypothetical protein [Megamonas hypermegale]